MTNVLLHNLHGCIILLEKNYSHAAITLARSIFEIFLRSSYAHLSAGFRGYAELEFTATKDKIKANERIIKLTDKTSAQAQRLIIENHKLGRSLTSLQKKYTKMSKAPSLRQMALILDANTLGKHYDLYVKLYETGSAHAHADNKVVTRSARLSGTQHFGIFADTFQSTKLINELLMYHADLLCKLPETTQRRSLIFYNKINQMK